VTLQVDHSPKVRIIEAAEVSEDGHRGEAKQALGFSATLTCRIEAVPVAKAAWFFEPLSDENVKRPLPRRPKRLHSGDDLEISIGGYSDGVMISSVKISSVAKRHFGRYK